MKKQLIIMGIVLLIGTNIATLLYYRSNVKVVEKVVTVINEMPCGLVEKSTAQPGLKSCKEAQGDFDDSPYISSSSAEAYSDGQTHREIRDTPKENKETAEKTTLTSEPNSYAHEGVFYDDRDQNNALDIDDIPMPELPLCNRDFEVESNDGGFENVALPQLPTIN
jgi:hypothetical protein